MRTLTLSGCLLLIAVNAGCAAERDDGKATPADVTSGEVTNADGSSAHGQPVDPNVWHEACPVDVREQRMIDVGEVTLNVACQGAGPTVVFLHGFPEFHYSWNKVMEALATEYRLIAPDQRGYNISQKPQALEDYEIPHLVGDIVNLLPLVSPDPVILVAHDWGGPVGWAVAHTPEAHIRAFVATNGPHPLRFSWLLAHDAAQQEASSYMDLFRLEGSEEYFTEEVLVDTFGGHLTEEELDEYKVAWAQPGAILGGLNWYRANDLQLETVEALMADLLPTVTVPTTVMWGLADTALIAANAQELDAWVEDLEVETFEGVDHWIEHRIPDEVARVVREIDARASPSAP